MTGWAVLTQELDAWAAEGRTATFWWRDDDAAAPVPALDRLLALAAATDVPLALSVVPADAVRDMARRLSDERRVTLLQHGYAHINRAPPGGRKSEFPPERGIALVKAELRQGRRRLETLFARLGERLLPVLVPPWNRMHVEYLRHLPRLGFTGISGYLARPAAEPHPGLRMANTHVDVIAWKGSRGFIGTDAALDLLVAHLAHRRTGRVDRDEPTGLLTHHLAHDEAAWTFVAECLDRCRSHAAARWLAADDIFERAGAAIGPAKIA